MPITAENYRRAEEALARAKMDPNADPAKIAKVEANLRDYYSSAPEQPSNPAPEGPPPPPASNFEGRGSVGGYFYNPSVDEFRGALKNRAVREKLGLGDNYSSGETSGEAYLKSQVPELAELGKADISQLGESSDEYKRYSEYAYQQALSKDPSIKRYDDLDVFENPAQKALGAVIKHGPAAVLGAEKSIGLGVPRELVASQALLPPTNPVTGMPIAPEITQTPEAQATREGVRQRFQQNVSDLESLSPAANTVGQIASYAVPVAPANLAQKGLETALRYGSANKFVKPIIGGTIGGAVSAGEGAVQDVVENPDISLSELGERAVPRAVMGGAMGAGGNVIAQVSDTARKAARESPRWRSVKNLEDVGGDTHILKGVTAPEAVRQNITEGAASREVRTGGDIAAQKVAPKIQESVKGQIDAQRKLSAQELEDYINRPEIASQQESMKPVADGILGMFQKGTFEGAVSGDIKHPNAGAVRTFRDVLNSIGEVAHVSPQEAALFAQKQGGTMLSDRQIKALGLQGQPGTVPVYVPSKMGARALLEMEQMIDEKLKMANIEGGANNPIWKDVNRNVKSVRDRFGAPQPEFNNPGEPFAPATPKPSNVDKIQPPKAVGVDNPPMPEALPGIGNDPRLKNNPFRPNRFDPNVVIPQAPVEVVERRVADQAVSHPERRLQGQIAHTPEELQQASILDEIDNTGPSQAYESITPPSFAEGNQSEDIVEVIRKNTDENGLANVPAIVKAMGGDKDKVHRLLMEAEANDLIELRPEGGLNRYSKSDLDLMIPGHDNIPLGGVRILKRDTPAPSSPHPSARNSAASHPTEVLKNEEVSSSVPPAISSRGIHREYTPEDYKEYNYHGEDRLGRRWVDVAPEHKASLDEVDWEKNIQAQKQDAKRQGGLLDKLNKELSETQRSQGLPVDEKGYQTGKVALSDREIDREIMRQLRGGQPDPDLAPEAQEIIKRETPKRLPALMPYLRREQDELAQRQQAKTKAPGGKQSYESITPSEDLEELGSSAVVQDSSAPPPSRKVNNTLASSKTEAVESAMSQEEVKRIVKENAKRFKQDQPLQIKSSLGAESKLDMQLLKRDIADQAKIDKTNNPLEIISSKVGKDGKLDIEIKPVKEKKDIPFETLDDGTKVYGLSAMQRRHHKELERLGKLEDATSAGSLEGAHKKVLNYKYGEGHPYTDKALAEEADKLGIRQQLEEVPATREFPNLRARAWGGSGEGPLNALKDAIGFRADAFLGALADAKPNPFAPPPTSTAGRISQYMMRQGIPGYPLLSGKAGKAGARYGNEVSDSRDKEKKKSK